MAFAVFSKEDSWYVLSFQVSQLESFFCFCKDMWNLEFNRHLQVGGSDYRLIYRHYATLYFIFCVDSSESELGILDLIQVFLRSSFMENFKFFQVLVETLDRCFENVCELDLIFHMDKVHFILNEMVMGGMVLETSLQEIVSRFHEQEKIVKQEVKFVVNCMFAMVSFRKKIGQFSKSKLVEFRLLFETCFIF